MNRIIRTSLVIAFQVHTVEVPPSRAQDDDDDDENHEHAPTQEVQQEAVPRSPRKPASSEASARTNIADMTANADSASAGCRSHHPPEQQQRPVPSHLSSSSSFGMDPPTRVATQEELFLMTKRIAVLLWNQVRSLLALSPAATSPAPPASSGTQLVQETAEDGIKDQNSFLSLDVHEPSLLVVPLVTNLHKDEEGSHSLLMSRLVCAIVTAVGPAIAEGALAQSVAYHVSYSLSTGACLVVEDELIKIKHSSFSCESLSHHGALSLQKDATHPSTTQCGTSTSSKSTPHLTVLGSVAAVSGKGVRDALTGLLRCVARRNNNNNNSDDAVNVAPLLTLPSATVSEIVLALPLAQADPLVGPTIRTKVISSPATVVALGDAWTLVTIVHVLPPSVPATPVGSSPSSTSLGFSSRKMLRRAGGSGPLRSMQSFASLEFSSSSNDLLQLASPDPHSKVASPLMFCGEATSPSSPPSTNQNHNSSTTFGPASAHALGSGKGLMSSLSFSKRMTDSAQRQAFRLQPLLKASPQVCVISLHAAYVPPSSSPSVRSEAAGLAVQRLLLVKLLRRVQAAFTLQQGQQAQRHASAPTPATSRVPSLLGGGRGGAALNDLQLLRVVVRPERSTMAPPSGHEEDVEREDHPNAIRVVVTLGVALPSESSAAHCVQLAEGASLTLQHICAEVEEQLLVRSATLGPPLDRDENEETIAKKVSSKEEEDDEHTWDDCRDYSDDEKKMQADDNKVEEESDGDERMGPPQWSCESFTAASIAALASARRSLLTRPDGTGDDDSKENETQEELQSTAPPVVRSSWYHFAVLTTGDLQLRLLKCPCSTATTGNGISPTASPPSPPALQTQTPTKSESLSMPSNECYYVAVPYGESVQRLCHVQEHPFLTTGSRSPSAAFDEADVFPPRGHAAISTSVPISQPPRETAIVVDEAIAEDLIKHCTFLTVHGFRNDSAPHAPQLWYRVRAQPLAEGPPPPGDPLFRVEKEGTATPPGLWIPSERHLLQPVGTWQHFMEVFRQSMKRQSVTASPHSSVDERRYQRVHDRLDTSLLRCLRMNHGGNNNNNSKKEDGISPLGGVVAVFSVTALPCHGKTTFLLNVCSRWGCVPDWTTVLIDVPSVLGTVAALIKKQKAAAPGSPTTSSSASRRGTSSFSASPPLSPRGASRNNMVGGVPQLLAVQMMPLLVAISQEIVLATLHESARWEALFLDDSDLLRLDDAKAQLIHCATVLCGKPLEELVSTLPLDVACQSLESLLRLRRQLAALGHSSSSSTWNGASGLLVILDNLHVCSSNDDVYSLKVLAEICRSKGISLVLLASMSSLSVATVVHEEACSDHPRRSSTKPPPLPLVLTKVCRNSLADVFEHFVLSTPPNSITVDTLNVRLRRAVTSRTLEEWRVLYEHCHGHRTPQNGDEGQREVPATCWYVQVLEAIVEVAEGSLVREDALFRLLCTSSGRHAHAAPFVSLALCHSPALRRSILQSMLIESVGPIRGDGSLCTLSAAYSCISSFSPKRLHGGLRGLSMAWKGLLGLLPSHSLMPSETRKDTPTALQQSHSRNSGMDLLCWIARVLAWCAASGSRRVDRTTLLLFMAGLPNAAGNDGEICWAADVFTSLFEVVDSEGKDDAQEEEGDGTVFELRGWCIVPVLLPLLSPDMLLESVIFLTTILSSSSVDRQTAPVVKARVVAWCTCALASVHTCRLCHGPTSHDDDSPHSSSHPHYESEVGVSAASDSVAQFLAHLPQYYVLYGSKDETANMSEERARDAQHDWDGMLNELVDEWGLRRVTRGPNEEEEENDDDGVTVAFDGPSPHYQHAMFRQSTIAHSMHHHAARHALTHDTTRRVLGVDSPMPHPQAAPSSTFQDQGHWREANEAHDGVQPRHVPEDCPLVELSLHALGQLLRRKSQTDPEQGTPSYDDDDDGNREEEREHDEPLCAMEWMARSERQVREARKVQRRSAKLSSPPLECVAIAKRDQSDNTEADGCSSSMPPRGTSASSSSYSSSAVTFQVTTGHSKVAHCVDLECAFQRLQQLLSRALRIVLQAQGEGTRTTGGHILQENGVAAVGSTPQPKDHFSSNRIEGSAFHVDPQQLRHLSGEDMSREGSSATTAHVLPLLPRQHSSHLFPTTPLTATTMPTSFNGSFVWTPQGTHTMTTLFEEGHNNNGERSLATQDDVACSASLKRRLRETIQECTEVAWPRCVTILHAAASILEDAPSLRIALAKLSAAFRSSTLSELLTATLQDDHSPPSHATVSAITTSARDENGLLAWNAESQLERWADCLRGLRRGALKIQHDAEEAWCEALTDNSANQNGAGPQLQPRATLAMHRVLSGEQALLPGCVPMLSGNVRSMIWILQWAELVLRKEGNAPRLNAERCRYRHTVAECCAPTLLRRLLLTSISEEGLHQTLQCSLAKRNSSSQRTATQHAIQFLRQCDVSYLGMVLQAMEDCCRNRRGVFGDLLQTVVSYVLVHGGAGSSSGWLSLGEDDDRSKLCPKAVVAAELLQLASLLHSSNNNNSDGGAIRDDLSETSLMHASDDFRFGRVLSHIHLLSEKLHAKQKAKTTTAEKHVAAVVVSEPPPPRSSASPVASGGAWVPKWKRQSS